MFSGITNYLFGAAEDDAPETTTESTETEVTNHQAEAKPDSQTETNSPTRCKLHTRPVEGDWEIVDATLHRPTPCLEQSMALSQLFHEPDVVDEETRLPTIASNINNIAPCSGADNFALPLPYVGKWAFPLVPCVGETGNISGDTSDVGDTSSEVSAGEHVVHPSMEESWLVTPPPCFTAGGNSPHRMDLNPLEDMLIEHPSMSVYNPRGRQSSTGADSEGSESSTEVQTTTSLPQGRPALTQRGALAHRNRPRAVAAKVYHEAQLAVANSMQKSQQRQHRNQLSRHNVERQNRSLHVQSANKHPRRRHHLQARPSGANNNRKIHS